MIRVENLSKAFGKQIEAIPRENMLALQRYSWPGNTRELRNVVERAMIVGRVQAGLRRGREQGEKVGRRRVGERGEAAIRSVRSNGR